MIPNDTHRIWGTHGRWHHTHQPCAIPSFHTGQRLFQRSRAGSESFSESSSVGQAEETASEGHVAQSSSIHPPTPPPALEEDSRSASDALPETIQESSVQTYAQVEAAAASEERLPEGQEVQDSGR